MSFCGFALPVLQSHLYPELPDQIMKKISKMLLLMCCFALPVAVWADAPEVVFKENFEKGTDRWEILDPESWQLKKIEQWISDRNYLERQQV